MRYLLAACAAFALLGCGQVPNEEVSDPASVGAISSGGACYPIDYKEGVLYFPCSGARFANGLSLYKRNNPLVEVSGMTGDTYGGRDIGYFVNVEPAMRQEYRVSSE